MSRGPGRVQRAVLDAVERNRYLYVDDIAGPDATHAKRESILRAMRTLASAGQIELDRDPAGRIAAAHSLSVGAECKMGLCFRPAKKDGACGYHQPRPPRKAPAVESDPGLWGRMERLSDKYMDGIRPSSIRWSHRMTVHIGICHVKSKGITISDELKKHPNFVLDVTIVHELAHLIEPNHGKHFQELANRHPRVAEERSYWESYHRTPAAQLKEVRQQVKWWERWIERADAWAEYDRRKQQTIEEYLRMTRKYGDRVRTDVADARKHLAKLRADVRRLERLAA